MHKPECVQEKKKHKILWDFEIQTDPNFPTRRSDQVIIKKKKNQSKKNLSKSGLFCPTESQSENQRKRKRSEVLKPSQKTEK